MRQCGESLCTAWKSNHDTFKGKRSPRIFIFSLNNGTTICIPNFSIYIKRSEEYTYLIRGNFTFLFYTHVYYFNFNSTFFTFSNSVMIKVITKRVIAQRITREEWIDVIALVHVILRGLPPQLRCELLGGRGLILFICLSAVLHTGPDTWWVHRMYLLNLKDQKQSLGRFG